MQVKCAEPIALTDIIELRSEAGRICVHGVARASRRPPVRISSVARLHRRKYV